MTLDLDTLDALGADASWDAQCWAAAVTAQRRDAAKYAREVANNQRRAACDPVYREHIRKMKRECEQRRRARIAASSVVPRMSAPVHTIHMDSEGT